MGIFEPGANYKYLRPSFFSAKPWALIFAAAQTFTSWRGSYHHPPKRLLKRIKQSLAKVELRAARQLSFLLRPFPASASGTPATQFCLREVAT